MQPFGQDGRATHADNAAARLPACVQEANKLDDATELLRAPSTNGVLVPGSLWKSSAVPPPIREFWRSVKAADIVINTTVQELRGKLAATLTTLGFPTAQAQQDPHLAEQITTYKNLWLDELMSMALWSSAFAESEATSFFITSHYPTPFWHIDSGFAIAFQAFDGLGPEFAAPDAVLRYESDEFSPGRLRLMLAEAAPSHILQPGIILLTRDFLDSTGPALSTRRMLPHRSPLPDDTEQRQQAGHRLLCGAGSRICY